MRVLSRTWRRRRCSHRVTVSVRSTGVERVVCEECGHVSVHFLTDLDGEIERTSFARPIDREEEQGSGRHKGS